jgi:hypothetical protein
MTRNSLLPAEWLVADKWPTVKEWLQWLAAPYSDRKQVLIYWAGEANVRLTPYHYEAIARPGELNTGAGRA